VKSVLDIMRKYSDEQEHGKSLNTLYIHILQKISEVDFDYIDEFIVEFIKYKFDIKIYIGLLAITNNMLCKNSLVNRKSLLDSAYISARNTISDEKRIDTILNGF